MTDEHPIKRILRLTDLMTRGALPFRESDIYDISILKLINRYGQIDESIIGQTNGSLVKSSDESIISFVKLTDH